jgi:reactive intermediate/imine deaminase
MSGGVVKGFIVPGLPQPLLVPEQNEGWGRLRAAFEAAREELLACAPDVVLIYSVMWPSIIGHQIQADPAPEWVHVDELFHDLGSIPYRFRMDADFAAAFRDAAEARNLRARTVSYRGFPIDTGSVVALKLLTPNNEIPACIVSSNVYSDRAETIVLGKAAADAAAASGKRVAVVVVTTLSNRLFTDFIDPADDHIHSPKDDEWNRKILEFLEAGRLEDVAQLSREIHRQIRVHKVVNFKPMWWMSAVMGQHNNYQGRVYDYAAIYGTGAAVVSLTPSASSVGDKEYDEEDVEIYGGERGVLSGGQEAPAAAAAPRVTPAAAPAQAAAPAAAPAATAAMKFASAPKPVGAYPHARRVGDLLYLSGIGPRQPGTDEIPGGPIRDAAGSPLEYDVAAQTRAVIENVRLILEAAGSSLDKVVDITAFLVDMDRDFKAYNAVYAEYFTAIQATRTTVAVSALPTPIAVEFKVVALP